MPACDRRVGAEGTDTYILREIPDSSMPLQTGPRSRGFEEFRHVIAIVAALAIGGVASAALRRRHQEDLRSTFSRNRLLSCRTRWRPGMIAVAGGRRAVSRAHRRLRSARAGNQRVYLAEPEGARRSRGVRRRAKADGTRGPLHGIPVAIGDKSHHRGFADHRRIAGAAGTFSAGRDAFMVRKLRQAGAVVIGARPPPRVILRHHLGQL